MEEKLRTFDEWAEERRKKEKSVTDPKNYKDGLREKLKKRLEFVTGYWSGDKRLLLEYGKRSEIDPFIKTGVASEDLRKKVEKYKKVQERIEARKKELENARRAGWDDNDVRVKEIRGKLDLEIYRQNGIYKEYKRMEEESYENPEENVSLFRDLSSEMVELFDLILDEEIDVVFRGKKEWDAVDINKRLHIVELIEAVYSGQFWDSQRCFRPLNRIRLEILFPYESKFIDIQQWCKEHAREDREEIWNLPDNEENPEKRLKLCELKEDIIKKQKELHQMVSELEKKITRYRKIACEIEKENLPAKDELEKELDEMTRKEIESVI